MRAATLSNSTCAHSHPALTTLGGNHSSLSKTSTSSPCWIRVLRRVPHACRVLRQHVARDHLRCAFRGSCGAARRTPRVAQRSPSPPHMPKATAVPRSNISNPTTPPWPPVPVPPRGSVIQSEDEEQVLVLGDTPQACTALTWRATLPPRHPGVPTVPDAAVAGTTLPASSPPPPAPPLGPTTAPEDGGSVTMT